MTMTCGEATIRLLAKYGISTVFGIPGVHTLDMCRGFGNGVRHVQTRNEQGAGFMAEGWARATGQPGVALVISGPGVTNAATALAQSWCDSLPVLLLSAEPDTRSFGKGWGVLHEISEQKKVTEPITALSATAMRAADVPELLAQAVTIFVSRRPRPVHISIPIDVQAEIVDEEWQPITFPERAIAPAAQIARAAGLFKSAETPVIMVGGGAADAGSELTEIAEATGAIVFNSNAAKGVVPDDHPLCLGAAMVRGEGRKIIAEADVILAVGTELSETDSFVEGYEFNGKIIRIDIDPSKLNDLYPAEIGILGDAQPAMADFRKAIGGHIANNRAKAEMRVAETRTAIRSNLNVSETRHVKVLDALQETAPPETVFSGDACQVVYTGAFAKPSSKPRKWFFPAGYCALGNALPNAIGAKLAMPETPVCVLVGDGGFMFTMPELITAAELGLNLPVIISDNGGLKQIQDDMDQRGIERVGVEGINPDFELLAKACHCDSARPDNMEAFKSAFLKALDSNKPTVIVVEEAAGWLN